MRLILSIITFLLISNSQAQELLTYEDYMLWVRDFHPVAKQADITLRFGEQELRASRGAFDPVVFMDVNAKRYNSTNYYDRREAGIKVPTWGGVELKGVGEQNRGVFLNPEETVPESGLLALGASVNIGQGLFIDRRRAALRQAQIYKDATQAERELILNDLYLDATETYWLWAADYNNLNVVQEGLRLAEMRFDMIKESYIQGDFPAIDTVEAYTQVMDRLYRFQQAEINFFQSTQMLNTFLWDGNEEPAELLGGVIPENVLEGFVFDYNKESLREYVASHPELQLTDFDIATLEVERRFRAEMLKPVLRVDYNFLTTTINEIPTNNFFVNDYKWGLTFSTPLFLRRERGNLGFTKARIDFKNYQRDLKFLQLRNKLETEIFNFETVEQQLVTFTNNVTGLQRLLDGEMKRFEIGESSLFLVNAREVSLFQAQQTLNELAAKRKTAYAKMLNAAGLGFDPE
ncbi:Multidrug efflux protein, outer membrane component [Indibacter alkaliphilus LW1]|jgi:outer membrane protein TolC|uniref:Multidrug efflux protein, outer membrane component n=1 Tax=Indibacter alkaliphilus (strain CCUG 57479 / KCTC 22604 / LW1) TaxID=1189612 RepID=S2DH38_INDAL|nr:TolC family protein [Indibacter alkaliphilus]EOZ98299.1 Multidrug efflux protein, outer membrane component [Indibacter alkaliphilus LW1]